MPPSTSIGMLHHLSSFTEVNKTMTTEQIDSMYEFDLYFHDY